MTDLDKLSGFEYSVALERKGKSWVLMDDTLCTDPLRIRSELSDLLVYKYLCHAASIRSIRRTQLYNGFIQIVVTYKDAPDTKWVFCVRS